MSSAAAGLSNRLRVAVLASDAGVEGRLAALVAQFGHELVEAGASPDACLTDGTAFVALSAPVVALGAAVEDFTHLASVTPAPGLGVIYFYFRGELRVTVAHAATVLSDAEAAGFAAGLRARLLNP